MLSILLLISAAIIGQRWKFSFGTNTLAFFHRSACGNKNKRFIKTLAPVVQTCRKKSLGFPPSVGALSTVKGSQSFWVGKAASYAYTVPCCADHTKRVSLSSYYLVAASSTTGHRCFSVWPWSTRHGILGPPWSNERPGANVIKLLTILIYKFS